SSEASAVVRERVIAARRIQLARWTSGLTASRTNAGLTQKELEKVAAPDGQGRALVASAVAQLGLSARAYVKVLRVARTIADLDGEARVRALHVQEGVLGRLLDRDGLRTR